jgi:hypothetical protein
VVAIKSNSRIGKFLGAIALLSIPLAHLHGGGVIISNGASANQKNILYSDSGASWDATVDLSESYIDLIGEAYAIRFESNLQAPIHSSGEALVVRIKGKSVGSTLIYVSSTAKNDVTAVDLNDISGTESSPVTLTLESRVSPYYFLAGNGKNSGFATAIGISSRTNCNSIVNNWIFSNFTNSFQEASATESNCYAATFGIAYAASYLSSANGWNFQSFGCSTQTTRGGMAATTFGFGSAATSCEASVNGWNFQSFENSRQTANASYYATTFGIGYSANCIGSANEWKLAYFANSSQTAILSGSAGSTATFGVGYVVGNCQSSATGWDLQHFEGSTQSAIGYYATTFGIGRANAACQWSANEWNLQQFESSTQTANGYFATTFGIDSVGGICQLSANGWEFQGFGHSSQTANEAHYATTFGVNRTSGICESSANGWSFEDFRNSTQTATSSSSTPAYLYAVTFGIDSVGSNCLYSANGWDLQHFESSTQTATAASNESSFAATFGIGYVYGNCQSSANGWNLQHFESSSQTARGYYATTFGIGYLNSTCQSSANGWNLQGFAGSSQSAVAGRYAATFGISSVSSLCDSSANGWSFEDFENSTQTASGESYVTTFGIGSVGANCLYSANGWDLQSFVGSRQFASGYSAATFGISFVYGSCQYSASGWDLQHFESSTQTVNSEYIAATFGIGYVIGNCVSSAGNWTAINFANSTQTASGGDFAATFGIAYVIGDCTSSAGNWTATNFANSTQTASGSVVATTFGIGYVVGVGGCTSSANGWNLQNFGSSSQVAAGSNAVTFGVAYVGGGGCASSANGWTLSNFASSIQAASGYNSTTAFGIGYVQGNCQSSACGWAFQNFENSSQTAKSVYYSAAFGIGYAGNCRWSANEWNFQHFESSIQVANGNDVAIFGVAYTGSGGCASSANSWTLSNFANSVQAARGYSYATAFGIGHCAYGSCESSANCWTFGDFANGSISTLSVRAATFGAAHIEGTVSSSLKNWTAEFRGNQAVGAISYGGGSSAANCLGGVANESMRFYVNGLGQSDLEPATISLVATNSGTSFGESGISLTFAPMQGNPEAADGWGDDIVMIDPEGTALNGWSRALSMGDDFQLNVGRTRQMVEDWGAKALAGESCPTTNGGWETDSSVASGGIAAGGSPGTVNAIGAISRTPYATKHGGEEPEGTALRIDGGWTVNCFGPARDMRTIDLIDGKLVLVNCESTSDEQWSVFAAAADAFAGKVAITSDGKIYRGGESDLATYPNRHGYVNLDYSNYPVRGSLLVSSEDTVKFHIDESATYGSAAALLDGKLFACKADGIIELLGAADSMLTFESGCSFSVEIDDYFAIPQNAVIVLVQGQADTPPSAIDGLNFSDAAIELPVTSDMEHLQMEGALNLYRAETTPYGIPDEFAIFWFECESDVGLAMAYGGESDFSFLWDSPSSASSLGSSDYSSVASSDDFSNSSSAASSSNSSNYSSFDDSSDSSDSSSIASSYGSSDYSSVASSDDFSDSSGAASSSNSSNYSSFDDSSDSSDSSSIASSSSSSDFGSSGSSGIAEPSAERAVALGELAADRRNSIGMLRAIASHHGEGAFVGTAVAHWDRKMSKNSPFDSKANTWALAVGEGRIFQSPIQTALVRAFIGFSGGKTTFEAAESLNVDRSAWSVGASALLEKKAFGNRPLDGELSLALSSGSAKTKRSGMDGGTYDGKFTDVALQTGLAMTLGLFDVKPLEIGCSGEICYDSVRQSGFSEAARHFGAGDRLAANSATHQFLTTVLALSIRDSGQTALHFRGKLGWQCAALRRHGIQRLAGSADWDGKISYGDRNWAIFSLGGTYAIGASWLCDFSANGELSSHGKNFSLSINCGRTI